MASLLSSAFSTLRIEQMYVRAQPNHLQFQSGFMYCRPNISITFPRCRRFLGSFVSPRSLDISGESSKGRVALDSTDFQRSKLFDDCSTDPSENDIKDLEKQLEDLFHEVKTMIKMGKEDNAKDLLRANYEAVKEQVDSGAHGIEEAAVLDVIALGYMALGDLSTVGSVTHVLQGIVDGLKDEELLLDSILMHMGSLYAKLEKFEASIGFYRRSLQVMERKYGSRSSFLSTPLMGLAKVQEISGRASEAIATYHRVIKLLESSKTGESERLVLPLSALGDLLLKEGKASEAERLFSRVLDIHVKSYGEKDGRVGMAMCSLAKVKCAKGDVNEAIDLYKSAIKIIVESKHMAPGDKLVEMLRIDLAELLHVVGRGQEGRALLEECLVISEKSKGKDHPSSVQHLMNLAISYSRSKNFAEAERLLRISLQIMARSLPPDDPSITFPMLHLAITLYNLRRDEEAETLALNVLHIREKAFGKDSLPVGEALDCLVSIQSRLEKDESELVKLLKRVLKIQETAFGPESEEVVETLKKIVYYLDKGGMKNEKYPLQRRLSALRDKQKNKVVY